MASTIEQRDPVGVMLATTVRALYLHGPRASVEGDIAPTPMIAVAEVEAVDGKGLAGARRHLRATRRDGKENPRQVSLIDEATLERHAARFGSFPWEFVKSQIVLEGAVDLPSLLGHRIVFGEGEDAVLLELTIRRDPCFAMDLIVPGLREAMKGGAQGALARVLRGGMIRMGQQVTIR